MLFSKYVPVLGALFAGAQASPAPIVAANNKALASRSTSSKSFNVAKSYNQDTLFDGLAPSVLNGEADVKLHLGLPTAELSGDIDVELNTAFLTAPTVTIDLGGVKAYIELDVETDAKVFESVELISSGKLDIDIPGLLDVQAGLALALDLIVSLDAAIDLSAGFYIDFPAGCFIEIDVLTSKVVNHMLDNLVAKTLPLTLGVDVDLDVDVTLEVGLRLRTELGVSADVDPLGIPLLSAGAEVAVWINLFDYTSVIIGNPSQPTPAQCDRPVTEFFALDVGIIVDVDVDVLDVVNLDLAPTISVTLASAPLATNCIGGSSSSSSAATVTATSTTLKTSTLPATSSSANNGGSSTGNGGSSSGSVSSSSGNGGSGTTVTHISSSGTTVTSTDNSASSSFTVTSVSSSAQTVTSTSGSSGKGSGSGSSGSTKTSAGAIFATTQAPNGMSTSTYFETTTVTITSCAASVVNCPASYTQKVVTELVVAKTTICPVTAAAASAHWSGNATTPASSAVTVTVPAECSNTVTFTTFPASSATTNTFTAPSSCSVVGTITMTGATATVTPTVAPTTIAPAVTRTAVRTSSASPSFVNSGSLITAKPSATTPGSGYATTMPVTAGAAGLGATHVSGFLALVAGLLLAL